MISQRFQPSGVEMISLPKSFDTAWRTLQGYEAMYQLRKGQMQGTTRGDIRSQIRFVSMAFGLAA